MGVSRTIGNVAKATVVQDQSERLEADLAAPDVLVSVPPTPQWVTRIVEVEGSQAIDANRTFKFTKCFTKTRALANVVSRGKGVTRIEADTQPSRHRTAVEDALQLFEAMSEVAALARQ